MPSLRSSILALSALALLLWCNPAHAERRVALVIGNGAYKVAPLKNPTNDAQDMADALREMGFDVTLKLNATNREMEEAVRTFGAKLKQGGLGLFYYAGHGVQVAGENFLIPVDTKIDAEADVKFGALNAGMALARMEDAGNDLNIVILDACRTNPFARSFRTAEQGLARMDAPKGSLIAYATAPGRVAADSGGTGRNGVYTSFLLRHMREPGQKVEEILKRVRADVVRATKDKQVPWESSSLIGDFYFVLPQGQTPVITTPAQPPVQKVATDSATTPLAQNKEEYSCLDEHSLRPEILYERGEQARKNGAYQEAVSCYRRAAEHGIIQAQFNLGVAYYRGIDTVLDYKESAKWFHLAADGGLTHAQVWLASLYDKGHGVPFDYASAIKWYRKAASGGDIESLFILGTRYSFGEKGVTQNYAEAERMYKLAAELNHSLAQFNLCILYMDGGKVSKNNILAYKWITIAIAGGNLIANTHDEAVSIREKIAATLSPAEISRAQRLASQWRPKTPEELGYKLTAVAGVAKEPTPRGGGKVAARKDAKAMK